MTTTQLHIHIKELRKEADYWKACYKWAVKHDGKIVAHFEKVALDILKKVG